MPAWRAAWPALLDLVFPPRCVVHGCGIPGAWLCRQCAADVVPIAAPRCACCGAPLAAAGGCPDCRGEVQPFRRATAAGAYVRPLRDAVHALKYHHVRDIAPVLGRLAADACLAEGVEAGAIVMPVPSHRHRTAERAIDHTRLLAEATAAALGLPCRIDVVVRTRHTRPQVGLAPPERRANVAGAFAVAGGIAVATPVILVDDVMTTGATARACAEALRAAGAPLVDVCTVARAIERPSTADGRSPEGRLAHPPVG